MKITNLSIAGSTLAALALVAAQPAAAQSGMDNTGGSRSSWLPNTESGYVGLNIGRGDFDTPCAGLTCEDSDRTFKIYTGGAINPWLGAEFAYLNTGTVDRAGGQARAYGLNLSAVGTFPFNEQVFGFAKAGITYGRTRLSAAPGAPVATGRDNGWGPSFGFGGGFNFTPNWSAVLEWERQSFEFPGGRNPVYMTTLGVKYKF